MVCCVLMAAVFAGAMSVRAALFGRRDGRAQAWRLDGDGR